VHSSWLGFIEMFVVLAFALGWGVLELVTLRIDKERANRAAESKSAGQQAGRD
jgi:hypothetical protein